MSFLVVEKQHLESCQVFLEPREPRESHYFPCFLTEDWIEKHAELQVALALAVGGQQLEPWMQHREGIVRGCSQVKFRNPHWPTLSCGDHIILVSFTPVFAVASFEPLM